MDQPCREGCELRGCTLLPNDATSVFLGRDCHASSRLGSDPPRSSWRAKGKFRWSVGMEGWGVGRGRSKGCGATYYYSLFPYLPPTPGCVVTEGRAGPQQCLLCPWCLAQGLAQSKSVVVLRKQLWAPVTSLPSASFSCTLPSTLKICGFIPLC